MTDLASLIERVEAAEGPDEILSTAICDYFAGDKRARRHVTGSIDDALALVDRVLPGEAVSMSAAFARATVSVNGIYHPRNEVWAKSPPLAIVLALLKAVEAHPTQTPL